MAEDYACPICNSNLATADQRIVHLVNIHTGITLAERLIHTHAKQQTQAAMIREMSETAKRQSAALGQLQEEVDHLKRQEAILRANNDMRIGDINQLQREARAARQVAKVEADRLYENLQHAVDKLAGAEAERDQALEEAASLRAQLDSARDVARGTMRMANDSASNSETVLKWWQERQREAVEQGIVYLQEAANLRKQLAQVLEQVAGARLAVNKALAVGEVDAAHLAALNGYGDVPQYMPSYRNGQKIGVGVAPQNTVSAEDAHTAEGIWAGTFAGQFASIADGIAANATKIAEATRETAPPPPYTGAGYVLEPIATGFYGEGAPGMLRRVVCPACERSKLRMDLTEAGHGYLMCAKCEQEIATIRPRQFV